MGLGPDVVVEIAFNDGPYVASPTWTAITTYVREVTIRRGRADDFEQFDTGTAQLVLDNRDRRFDPFYTSGAYYLKLTPRRQIRIRGTANGTTYDVFRGYVAGWPVTWSEAGYDSTVTIQAFDALGLMANEVVPTDWPDYYTRQLGATRFFRCNDSKGATTIRDQIGNNWTLSTFSASYPNFFEVPSLAAGINGTAAAVDYYTGTFTTSASTPTYLSLSAWVQLWAPGTADALTIKYEKGTRGIEFGCYQNRDFYAYSRNASGPRYFTGTLPFNPQLAPFHVAVYAYDGNVGVYINGVSMTGTTTVSGGSAGGGETMLLTDGFYSEVAIYETQLTQAQVTQSYNAGLGRFSETTTARMQRLIGTTDFPAALQGFTGSPVASVAEIGTGTGVIPEMQLVADSEGGEIYVSKTGVLTTTNRTDVWTATRSANVQATFTDSGVGLRYGPEVSIELDGDNLKNDVTVTFSGDGEVNAYSDAVIDAYGAAATTIETQLADPTSAAQLALVELGVEGSLVPRISPIDVSVNTAAADWQTILGLELLDRVTFKRTPTVGNQFAQNALINAIDHQIVPGEWRTQLTLSMRYTSPLTADDDILGTADFNYAG